MSNGKAPRIQVKRSLLFKELQKCHGFSRGYLYIGIVVLPAAALALGTRVFRRLQIVLVVVQLPGVS